MTTAEHDQNQEQDENQSVDLTGDSTDRATVVGIGASAGGLEALQRFLKALPPDTGMAFVVVVHLSPDFRSMMDDLLSKYTRMPVKPVEEGQIVAPDHVYVIQPGTNIRLCGNHLELAPQHRGPGHAINLPVDIFFHSLAEHRGERAIGIVLSGTGTDGSRGARAIKDHGGIVLVQSEDSAKFDGMPKAAIVAVPPDSVQSPEELADTITEIASSPCSTALLTEQQGDEQAGLISQILTLLNEACGNNLSYYKNTTLARRISRRMQIRATKTLADYRALIEEDEAESQALYRDLLIGVTSFFRNPDAFKCLQQTIFSDLANADHSEAPYRIWVPACSTGEEAYSLAILVDELQGQLKTRRDVKLFATDVFQQSLEFASAGLYPESIMADLSTDRLTRYFNRRNQGYEVSRRLRDMIIFARQNALEDAPFTRMDLVSCRNFLIYLEPDLQKKLLAILHYALRHKGILFLGSAESASMLPDEFETVENNAKVFRKKRNVNLPIQTRRSATLDPEYMVIRTPIASEQRKLQGNGELAHVIDFLSREDNRTTILANINQSIKHVFGDAAGVIRPMEGPATHEVTRLVVEELSVPITTAFHRLNKGENSILYSSIMIQVDGQSSQVDLRVSKLPATRTVDEHFLIVIDRKDEANVAEKSVTITQLDHDADRQVLELESELQQTRESLQAMIEEMETTNEEQQSTNEELIASNEELQSTNEELHSVNEELHTVNVEYQSKIEELTQMTQDMDNLMASTEIGTVFLDNDLCIRKFTPAITEIIPLVNHDIGRSIEAFTVKFDAPSLMNDIRETLKNGKRFEREVSDRSGRVFLKRILPYQVEHNQIDGVVISFIDISSLKLAQRSLRMALDAMKAGVWSWDLNSNETIWDDRMEAIFGLEPGGFNGHIDMWKSMVHPDDLPGALEAVEWASAENRECDMVYRATADGENWRSIRALALTEQDPRGNAIRMTGLCVDVTDEIADQKALTESVERFREITDTINELFWITDAEEMQFIYVSPAYRKTWGRDPEQLYKNPLDWLEAVHPDDRDQVRQAFTEHALSGAFDETFRIIDQDGNIRWIRDRSYPIRDDRGRVVRIAGVATDITQLQQATVNLARSNEMLEQANQDLSQFASIASHDLQQPLRTVSGYAYRINKQYNDELSQDMKQMFGRIEHGVNQMQGLIDSLREFTDITSGVVTVNVVDLAVLLDEVITGLESDIAANPGTVIEYDNLPSVVCNEQLVGQVLQNLISNALKYRSGQPPHIRIEADERANEWEIRVSDNGIGIDPRHQERVFQIFKRLDPSEQVEGKGIGLAVVKKIVERHDGHVFFTPNEAGGTTFTFTISKSISPREAVTHE